MSKKLTVGEIAKRAAAGISDQPNKGLDPKQIVFALLLGLCLATAAAAGFQAINTLRSLWAVKSTERAASTIAAELTAQIKQAKTDLDRVAGSTNAAELLNNTYGFDRVQAKQRMKLLLPTAIDVDLLQGADVGTAIGGRFAEYGFAKSEALFEAQETGRVVPAQLHFEKEANIYTIVLAEPIKRADSVMGYLLAKFPAKDLKAKIEAGSKGGLLQLLQKGVNDDSTMLSAGDGDRENFIRVPIEGSRLTMAWSGKSTFGLLPIQGWVQPMLIALTSLGLAGLLMYLRSRPQLFADMANRLKPATKEEVATSARQENRLEAQKVKETQAKLEALRAQEAPLASAAPASASVSSTESALPPMARANLAGLQVDPSIFRAYDIRGVVGSTLNEGVANLLGRALGSEAIAAGFKEMVVARDGRLSGPSLSAALITGLRAAGCNVIDLGAVPTPVLYFATYQLNTGCGVMVTGSHNPPDYNGFKMMIGGTTLAESAIQKLKTRILQRSFSEGQGSLQSMDVANDYIERISSDIQLETPLRVVIDAGNGIAGAIGPKLMQSIGCDVEPLYCEVDGTFPNHHPDPSDPHNLRDLKVSVKQMNADIGLAFDGDGDRLGVVTRSGKIIYPDRLLMLFAKDVLSRVPGASIIFDVKCTGSLSPVIRSAGGIPVMWKTGHSLIKGKMKEIDAALAGEMSGHFFFKERWYGFDDGLYAACRFLEILAASGLDADELFEDIPDAFSTPELKIEMTEGEHYKFIEKFIKQAQFPGARLTTIDGIRADFDDSWGLVRCSNTTPCLVLRFEGTTEAALQSAQLKFKEQLLAVDRSLKVPF